MPMAAPMPVPMMRPSRIDSREMAAEPTLLSSRMTAKVMKARAMFCTEP